MRKKIIFSVFLLFFAVILTACSNPQSVGNENQVEGERNSRPDFGQPERESDIRGVVKSIVGNEVDILKLDIGQNRQAGATSTIDNTNSESKPENSISLNASGAPTGARGGMGMAGGGPGGPGSEQDSSTRADMLETLKAMSSGEEKVIIPVGIRMLKSNLNGKTREMLEANLSDISADKMITVWLNQDILDRKIAEFVLIN